jgi:Mn2+/Fe2+ NRAMP family transporter
MNRLKQLFSSFGPAIIVAAIVLGPGSILTSSKAGAQFGYIGIAAIVIAVVLMIAMVALAGRIGVIYEDSPL